MDIVNILDYDNHISNNNKIIMKLKQSRETKLEKCVRRQEEIITILTAGRGNRLDKIISELLENERTLTLAETYDN